MVSTAGKPLLFNLLNVYMTWWWNTAQAGLEKRKPPAFGKFFRFYVLKVFSSRFFGF